MPTLSGAPGLAAGNAPSQDSGPSVEQMLRSGLGLAKSGVKLGELLDLPGASELSPYLGPASFLMNIGTGNWPGVISGIPGALSGASSLLSGIAPAVAEGLGATAGYAAGPLAIAGSMLGNAMSQAAERKKNIGSEIARGQRNVGVGLGQFAQGAAGSPNPLGQYSSAMQGLEALGQMSDPFNKSGSTKHVSGPFGSGGDMRMPDYSQQIGLIRALWPSVMMNAIGGEQALSQGQNLTAQNAPGTQGDPRPTQYGPIQVQGQDVTLRSPEQFFDWATPLWLNGAPAPEGISQGEKSYTTQWTPGQDQGALAYTDQPVYTATQTQWRPDLQADLAKLTPQNMQVGLMDLLQKYLGPSSSPFAKMLAGA